MKRVYELIVVIALIVGICALFKFVTVSGILYDKDVKDFGIAVMLCSIYMYPYLNALMRKHRNAQAIFFANLFFGWTILGYCICLIWSFTANVEKGDKK